MTTQTEKSPSKRILKTAERYIARLQSGERLMRDSRGRIQWADGRNVGPSTLAYMMDNGIIKSLDTDLFGDPKRGQTIGLAV